jgi:hypothetical protein
MRGSIVVAVLSSSAIARTGGAIKGDVLVWDDATLYVEPADDAPSMQLVTFDRAATVKLVGHVVPMRVVGHHGDFLEVEAIADGQCVGSTLEADGVTHLRVFVKEDALAPVLTKPWRKTFDDDSRVVLGAGEPVVALAGGVVFRVDDVGLHADVPAASVGRAYAAITPAPLVPDHPRFQLRAGANAMIAGQTYTAPGEPFRAHAAHAIEHPHKDASRFAIRTRCGELDVIAPDDAVEPYKERTDHPYRPLHQAAFEIPTQLSTRAGRRAGVASKDIVVDQPASGAAIACFEAAVQIETPPDLPTDYDLQHDAKIELCAPASALRDDR